MFCRDFSFAYSIKYIHTEPQFCGFKTDVNWALL